MPDPDPDALGVRIAAAWEAGTLVPGRGGERPRVVLEGTGESFSAWRLEIPSGAAPLLVRALRPEAAAPGPIGGEHPLLEFLPPGLGPRPVHAHPEPGAPLGAPYLVTTHVPGRVLPPPDWSPAHLRAHARAVARLHGRTWSGRGPMTRPPDADGGAAPGPLCLHDEAAAAFADQTRRHPALADDPGLAALQERALAVCADAEDEFAALTRFSIAHGDLCATNVVWDEKGRRNGQDVPAPRPRFIDFEWAQLDDPARDLAIIGGPVHGGPWYVPLDEDAVDGLLQTYRAARLASLPASAAEDPGLGLGRAALRRRRDAWEAYEKTAMLLHVTSRAAAGDPVHRSVLPELRGTLAARLGVAPAPAP